MEWTFAIDLSIVENDSLAHWFVLFGLLFPFCIAILSLLYQQCYRAPICTVNSRFNDFVSHYTCSIEDNEDEPYKSVSKFHFCYLDLKLKWTEKQKVLNFCILFKTNYSSSFIVLLIRFQPMKFAQNLFFFLRCKFLCCHSKAVKLVNCTWHYPTDHIIVKGNGTAMVIRRIELYSDQLLIILTMNGHLHQVCLVSRLSWRFAR